MRYGVVRTVAGGVVALGASGLLGGCGMLGGGNSAQVCTDTKKAFQQYVTQVRSIPAAEPRGGGRPPSSSPDGSTAWRSRPTTPPWRRR